MTQPTTTDHDAACDIARAYQERAEKAEAEVARWMERTNEAHDQNPGPLRWVFDSGRGAMLDEHDRIVGYWTPPQAARDLERHREESGDYTPTTDEVRAAFVRALRDAFITSTSEHEAEFDRWLAAHDREVVSEAADQLMTEARLCTSAHETRLFEDAASIVRKWQA